MTMTPLKLPSDPNSEIYFDANRLVVGYRQRTAPAKTMRSAALRVVVQCFGWVFEDRFFVPGSAITVGSGKGNTFRIPTKELPDHHHLIEYRQDGSIELTVNKHFEGIVQIGSQLKTLHDTPKQTSGALQTITLPKGSRGSIDHGTLRVYFEEIEDPEPVPPLDLMKSFTDPYFFRWLAVSVTIHMLILLALLLIAHFAPPPAEITVKDLPKRFQKIIISPQRLAEPPKRLLASDTFKGPQGLEGEGARAPGREGRRGRGVPGSARRLSGKDIGRTGVLDVFRKSGRGSALDELLGGSSGIPGDVDTAFKRAGRYGLPGERVLRSGKGLKGTGTGGGGLSTSIGQGLGTKGKGGGAKGPGLADFGTGRKEIAVSASIPGEEVFITGSIPKSEIARIMNNHMGQIRYCYQREVNVHPNLAGKVIVNFVIGLQGRVTSTRIQRTSLRNANVEQCMQNVIRRIPFPKPGGGLVEVIYPFVFRVLG